MESKTKIFGHPVHPMLIVFPLGLLATAVIFDIISIFSRQAAWSNAAFYMIPAGIVGGLVAAIFGFIDWLAIPRQTRAKFIGLWHALINVVVLALFALSWYFRQGEAFSPTIALTLSFAGAILALVSGWLGGELVDRLGVGVDDGAHVNAPNSLKVRHTH